jgi:hypothetical protein
MTFEVELGARAAARWRASGPVVAVAGRTGPIVEEP